MGTTSPQLTAQANITTTTTSHMGNTTAESAADGCGAQALTFICGISSMSIATRSIHLAKWAAQLTFAIWWDVLYLVKSSVAVAAAEFV